MKKILQLNEKDVRRFFLDEASYCTLDLPEYFCFSGVLKAANDYLGKNQLLQVLNSCEKDNRPSDYEDVNYVLINNKKAKYKWRRIELIHPIFYVGIVNEITEEDNWRIVRKRFEDFNSDEKIICCSIPVADTHKGKIVLNWWNSFEQQSIANSIDYSYMATTDIENCYPSIYTHSVAWAIHTKPVAKDNQRNLSLLGNKLDKYIRDMHNGQTNGIPQGSILMDFIAEIVLGYADELLSQELKQAEITDYKIIRYRDDYRIFANDVSIIEEVIKHLAIVLMSLNMNLSAEKTHVSNEILLDSIKKDKLYRITHQIDDNQTLQKRLLCLYDLSIRFPNSGSVKRELAKVYNEVFCTLDKRPNSYEQLISIILEIMHRNPDTYPLCIGLLSEVFKYLKPEVVQEYVKRITQKFGKEPFSDYLEIWLQRTTLYHNRGYRYRCSLCQKVYEDTPIWNSSWLETTIDDSSIINEDIIANITPNLSKDEVNKYTIDYNE